MTNAFRRWMNDGAPVDRPREVIIACDGVVGVLTLLGLEPVPEREACVACGCLCAPDEVCPGCRSARVTAAREAGAMAGVAS